MRHIPGFDGLRALAALAVLACHTQREIFNLGWIGLNLFFVLSGFLITGILIETRDRYDYFQRFYINRSARIFPAYFLCLGAIVAVGIAQTADISDWPWYVLYAQNWLYAFTEPRFFLLAANTWSLAVEEQFYLLWPAVVWITRSRRTLLRIAICMIVAGPLSRYAAMTVSDRWWATLGPLPCQLDMLGWGALGAILARSPGRFLVRLQAATPLLLAACLAWVFASGYTRFRDPADFRSDVLIGTLFIASLGPACLSVLLTARSGGWTTKILETTPLTYIGRISYGLYLYHWPIFLLVPGVSKLVLSFAAAVISYHFFETPIRSALRRSGPNQQVEVEPSVAINAR
jgi:peptidoglycan/LPS O-acetylase OafA/YrhL